VAALKAACDKAGVDLKIAQVIIFDIYALTEIFFIVAIVIRSQVIIFFQ